MKLTKQHGLYSIKLLNYKRPLTFQHMYNGIPENEIIVIALDMHDATLKAMGYLLVLNENKDKPSVLTADGSLNLNHDVEKDVKIGSVTFIDTNLIF